MIVYVDIVFIVNFIISFTFLLLIKFIVNGKESIKLILVCSAISVLLLFSFFLNKLFYNLFKICGGFIVVSLTLYKTRILEKLLRMIVYYFLQFSLVGFTNAFHIKGIVLILCLIILFICFIVYKYKTLVSKTNSFEKSIVIYIEKKKIKLRGYLDSGNMSTYKGNPIIYLDTKYLYLREGLKRKKTFVNTIDGVIEKEIYYLNEIEVNNKLYNDVYITFGNVKNYDCLLNVIMG